MQRQFVYFIRCGRSGPIKIGWAADATARMRELQVGCPFKLRLLATFECTSIGEEKSLHRRFCKYRIRGEWFYPHETLLAFIESVKADGKPREPDAGFTVQDMFEGTLGERVETREAACQGRPGLPAMTFMSQ